MKETKRGSSGTWHDIDIAEALKHLPKVGEYAYYYDYDEDKDLATIHRGIVEKACFSQRSQFPYKSGTDKMFCIHIKIKGKSEEFNVYFSQMDDVEDCDVFANMEDLKVSIEWQNIANVKYTFDIDEPLKFELEEEVKSTYFY